MRDLDGEPSWQPEQFNPETEALYDRALALAKLGNNTISRSRWMGPVFVCTQHGDYLSEADYSHELRVIEDDQYFELVITQDGDVNVALQDPHDETAAMDGGLDDIIGINQASNQQAKACIQIIAQILATQNDGEQLDDFSDVGDAFSEIVFSFREDANQDDADPIQDATKAELKQILEVLTINEEPITASYLRGVLRNKGDRLYRGLDVDVLFFSSIERFTVEHTYLIDGVDMEANLRCLSDGCLLYREGNSSEIAKVDSKHLRQPRPGSRLEQLLERGYSYASPENIRFIEELLTEAETGGLSSYQSGYTDLYY